jgi:hypothetical protein
MLNTSKARTTVRSLFSLDVQAEEKGETVQGLGEMDRIIDIRWEDELPALFCPIGKA